MTSEKNHIASLDSLRGLAATMVVAVHSLVCWRPEIFTKHARGVIEALLVPISGRAPVILFFILSGFVLAYSLNKRMIDMVSIFAFYMRRLFRLVPAAYVGLLLALLVFSMVRHFYSYDQLHLYLKDWIGSHYHQSLTDLPINLEFAANSINPVYWTLHVEVLGSLLMPIIVIVLQSRKFYSTIAMLVIMLLLPFFPYKFTYLDGMTNALIFCFPLGAMSFHLLNEQRNNRIKMSGYMGVVGAFILIFAHDLVGADSFLGKAFGSIHWLVPNLGNKNNIGILLQHYLESVGATALVCFLAIGGSMASILMFRPIVFLGKISYSLYVIHFSILFLIVSVFGSYLHVGLGNQSILLPIATFIVVMAISVPLSALSHRYIEMPGISIGHRLSGLIRERWGRMNNCDQQI